MCVVVQAGSTLERDVVLTVTSTDGTATSSGRSNRGRSRPLDGRVSVTTLRSTVNKGLGPLSPLYGVINYA